MSARSGLVGKKSSRPYLGPSEAIFSMDRKNPKNAKILPIFLGGPMGPIHPVWALAAIYPRWGNRYVHIVSSGSQSGMGIQCFTIGSRSWGARFRVVSQ